MATIAEQNQQTLDKTLDRLRAASLKAADGEAYTCGPPWFRTGSGVLVGSPDPHAGFLIADTDTSMLDQDDRDEFDDDDNAAFLAEAWNFARLILSRPDLLANLRAPAATDTAGEVERMRGALSGLIFYAEQLEHLAYDAADRGVSPAIRAARAALPATPDDPAAGDGGGR